MRHLTWILSLTTVVGCTLEPIIEQPSPQSLPLANSQSIATPTAPQKSIITPTARQQVRPTNINKPVPQQAAVPQPQQTFRSMDEFDPMKAIGSLPPAQEAGVDEIDDLDSESDFNVKFLWTWWGASGRERALKAFTEEEARQVEWWMLPGGWTRLGVQLTASELLLAWNLTSNSNMTRVAIDKDMISSDFRSRMARHLKIMRRQGVSDMTSRHLKYYQVVNNSVLMQGVVGFIASAQKDEDYYIAYYNAQGRLLWAYAKKFDTPLAATASPSPTPSPSPSAQ